MTPLRLRALVALVLLVAAFVGAQAWRPTEHLADTRPKVDLETMFPSTFGDWKVDERTPVQLISPDMQAVINRIYNQTLSRTYVNSQGQRIMLAVAYGGDQSDATRAHIPEVCYPAQGFQLVSKQSSWLSTPTHPVRVRQLVAQMGGRIEPITYWVIVGDHVALSGTDQKLAQLSYSVRGLIPDGMLVRVSSIDNNYAEAYNLHQAFVTAMAQSLRADARPQVIGRSGT
jgi:EpsI family protein